MSATTVDPRTLITAVKITLDKRTGMYILRSVEFGRMAIAATRAVLRIIAGNQGWTVVKAWN